METATLWLIQDPRANLKTEVTRKQSTPNFPKNERALFSCYLRFEICSSALLLHFKIAVNSLQ